jgi:hypothetical protein
MSELGYGGHDSIGGFGFQNPTALFTMGGRDAASCPAPGRTMGEILEDAVPESAAGPAAPHPGRRLHLLLVCAAAVVGRLPALGAWWCRDDWGQLARAAGIVQGDPGLPARWLSQHLYWSLTWPVIGLEAFPHAAIRLILHGAAAGLTWRLALRGGLGPAGALAAGLIFAASPLAFTPLYWASGIQELLAAVLALWAVERWLAGHAQGRRALLTAVAAAALSMLAKESGLGLPVLLIGFLWLGLGVRLEDKAFAWALVMLLLAVAVAEGVLVLQHFATGPGEPYDLGGARVVLLNLAIFGWWLLSPGPLLAGGMEWPMLVVGGLLWVSWAAWGAVRWRQGARLPLLALAGALLALGPALPLRQHVAPYLAYLALAGWALAVASLLPRLLPTPPRLLLAAAVLAAAWGWFGMRTRLGQRTELGLPADGVVAATSLSWDACGKLRSITAARAADDPAPVVLLQFPVDNATRERARRMGELWSVDTELYAALGGAAGPQLVLGRDRRFHWANGLVTASPHALVFAEGGDGLRFWGDTAQASLYAALTDVGLGSFERARAHLTRAAGLSGERIAFVYDEGQMLVPLQIVTARKNDFVNWTLGLAREGVSPQEIGGLQDLFFSLLSACTGQPVEDLTAGSRRVTPAPGSAPADTASNRIR